MAASYLGTGFLMLFTIWRALPARWLPVDAIGSLLAVAAVVAGVLIAKAHPSGKVVGMWVSGAWFAVGAIVCTALVWAASGIVGLYGPVGSGGALVLFFVALLVLPYMVGIPILQMLHCLRR